MGFISGVEAAIAACNRKTIRSQLHPVHEPQEPLQVALLPIGHNPTVRPVVFAVST